mmetsp:Transcript_22166/g.39860  ORF Transcript_22166/g.39860 Transcript_22166/m.39860 type:complete len:1016 (+) Transcript_22166:20-3067(+)
MWGQQVPQVVTVQHVPQVLPGVPAPRRLRASSPVRKSSPAKSPHRYSVGAEVDASMLPVQRQCSDGYRPRRQDHLATASAFLRPPNLPVSRSTSIDTSQSPDARTSRGSSNSPPGAPSDEAAGEEVQEVLRPRAWGTVERTFETFCGLKQDMDGKTFAKLCKDCDLIDRTLSATDVDIIFAKAVQKGQRRIHLEEFDAALELLAEKKSVTVDEICRMVRKSGGPVHNSTKAEKVRFHDDKGLYTGTHANGGPEVGRKGKGTVTWSSAWPEPYKRRSESRDGDDLSSPNAKDTPCSMASSTATTTDWQSFEVSPHHKRSMSISEKKVVQPLKGKDGTIEDTFKVYCASKADMDGKSFVKLCKDCNLIDSCLSAIDTDLIFAKVVRKGQRRIALQQFEEALKLIAEKKDVEEDDIWRLVAESGGLVHTCTKADSVRFHDDKSTYTGTHVHGGPDTRSRTSGPAADQLFSSTLRPDEGELPDLVTHKLEEDSPRKPSRAVGLESQAARRDKAPRKRLAITAKKKPPTGDNDDFTMVFTDVQGSTSLWEANPRAMEQALRLHDATIRQVLAKHSGYEVTTEGDAFQVAFHDTADAVAFCLDTQTELLHCDWPAATLLHPDASASSDGAWRGLRIRMGLHSGKPAAVTKHEMTGRWRYAGPMVAMAKAIEGVCHGGQIIVSAAAFSNIDGFLTQLGSPQVIDLGEHILEGYDLDDESSPAGQNTASVQLLQLVPNALAHDYSWGEGGRRFPPVISELRVRPGFEEAPAGDSITLCFVFTKGVRELAAAPGLAAEALGLLRACVREALRSSGEGSGYECQEDEGAFMLAFAHMADVVAFSVTLQRQLPNLPWPGELKQGAKAQEFSLGLRVAIGALSGSYTSRRPHASTGRADYFGTIVNRTARIAAAAHGGQVLLGGEAPLLQIPAPVYAPEGGYPTASVVQPSSGDRPVFAPVQTAQVLPLAALMSPQVAGRGWAVQRLGSFALKGIDSPIALSELRIMDAQGKTEVFPEPKTKGRVGQ